MAQAAVMECAQTALMSAAESVVTNQTTSPPTIDDKSAFAELMRTSMARALKKHGVEIAEHSDEMAAKIKENPICIDSCAPNGQKFLYREIEETFLWHVDLFEQHEGRFMDSELFEKMCLTPNYFKCRESFEILNRAILNDMNMLQYGTLIAYAAFINHACISRVQFGVVVDEEYVNMVLSALIEVENWHRLWHDMIAAKKHFITGFDD
jgi:hypothetical protein